MVKISVIIPVYNSEKYLKECLDSVLNQSFNDFEVICINDGSTDSSLKILNDYQSKDSRIKIISKENNGAASARNIGIKESQGEYVYFMDSDDILELTALEELYDLAETKNLDLIIFKLINFDDGTVEKYETAYYEMAFLKELVGQRIFNYNDIGENLFKIAVSPPGKFFKNDLISNIKFPEGYIFEDNAFFTEAILNAKSVYFYDKHLYNRRVRSDSVMGNNKDLKQADIIPIFNKMIDIVRNKNCFEEFKTFLLEYKVSSILMRFSLVEDRYKIEFFNRIKNDFQRFELDFNEVIFDFSKDNKLFYELILESETYQEFNLKMQIYDMKQKNKKLEISNNNLNKRNKKLKRNIDQNRKKYESLINSNSWKITKPFRTILRLFR